MAQDLVINGETYENVEQLAATNTEGEIVLYSAGNFEPATGAEGVGIASIVQTVKSTADGGSNVLTITLTNGNKTDFTVRNGGGAGMFPIATEDDNGKFMRVVNGKWAAVALTDVSEAGA